MVQKKGWELYELAYSIFAFGTVFVLKLTPLDAP